MAGEDRPQLRVRDCENCDKTIRSSDEKPQWRDLNGKKVCPDAKVPMGGHKPKEE